jgi:hypothetical protein
MGTAKPAAEKLAPLDPTRLPPLEPVTEQRTRRYALWAFLFFYLGCIPLWYETSRVQRVALPTLPVDEVTIQPQVVRLLSVVPELSKTDEARLAKAETELASLLDAQQWRVGGSDVVASPELFKASSVATFAAAADGLTGASASDSAPSWRVILALASSGRSSPVEQNKPIVSGRDIVIAVGAQDDERKIAEALKNAAAILQSLTEAQACRSDRTASSSSSSACATSRTLSQRLSFTLVNGESDSTSSSSHSQHWSWNFPAIQSAYLDGFLSAVAPYVTFSVDSSVMHFAQLTDVRPEVRKVDAAVYQRMLQPPQPASTKQDATSKDAAAPLQAHILPLHAFQQMMGAIGQWNNPSPLVPSSLEFFAYVPAGEGKRPMGIEWEEQTAGAEGEQVKTAMYVERFGGIAVINSPGECNTTRSSGPCELAIDGAAKRAMQVFLQQIRQTLSLTHHAAACPQCIFLPNRQTGIAEWELALLGRRLITVNLRETSRVLSSLYDLLDQVPHMPVNEEMKSMIEEALRQRQLCLQHLERNDFAAAGSASQSASLAAHRAFFHHDMLPALYFPDEHLYAVYLPLFLPISVPLLAALLKLMMGAGEKERKRKKQKIREQQEAEAAAAAASATASRDATLAAAETN